MSSGTFAPSPWRDGAERGQSLEQLTNALAEGRGTAYDATNTATFVWLECHAEARAVWAAWESVTRLSYQTDPLRMSDFLPRWERILWLSPAWTLTTSQRRAVVATKLATIGTSATVQALTDTCRSNAPNVFSALSFLTSATGVAHVYAGATIPGGVTIAAETAGSTMTWSSSIHHITAVCICPLWLSEAGFYAEANALTMSVLDFIPSWCNFEWVRDGVHGIGFWLDDEHNCDNERFD